MHGFKQSALDLGRCAVDFVCQDEIGEDRSASGEELSIFLIINHRADKISGKEVRRKLDSLKLRADGGGKRFNGKRLGETRNTLKENMSVAEEADQEPVDHLFLADNHF